MERKNNSNKNDLFMNVPRILPALKRAQKITAIAATYGFDWPKTDDVWEKIQEEIKEFAAALKSGKRDKIDEEMGDIFFTLVNLSRFVRVDAETALMKTTNKFLRRFSYIEKQLAAQGKSLEETDLAEMDELWRKAKEMRI